MNPLARTSMIAAALAAFLVAGSLQAATAAAPTPATHSVAAKDPQSERAETAEESADAVVAKAVHEATASGQEVVVDELTTPTTETTAKPDGTVTYAVSSVPVRTEQHGDWVAIDTDLVLRDGWWEPKASAAPVRFTNGGTDDLSRVQTPAGDWITETWPRGVLPTPRVDGPTATYVEILPGVDLKLTATDVGMASVYVVKTPSAAASEALADLHVDLGGAEVTRADEGNFEAETPSGDTITATSPLWWDSSDGGTSVSPGEENPAMPVSHEFSGDGVSIDVGETVEKMSPTYPVFIDPDWAAGAWAAWYTDAAYPNQSYLSAGQSDVLRVGRYQQYRSNMFFEFGISPLAGKQILAAQLATTQLKWASCPNSPIQVRLHSLQSPGFTWNQQDHNGWGPVLDTKNPGSCSSGAEAVGWNVTSGVQSMIGNNDIQFGFAPQDESAWSRRHFSRSATLYVTYNTPPNTPTNLSFLSPVRGCGTASAPAYLAGSSTTVGFYQTDPDPGNVDTNVWLYKTSDLVNPVQWQHPGLAAQGWKSVTFTDLVDGQAYAWRARGSDWLIDGASMSDWCYFTVDNTAPAAPTVSTTATSFTVGQAANVSVSGSTDVAGYEYWLAYGAPASTPPAAPVAVSRTDALPNCTQAVGGTRFACGAGSTAVVVSAAPVDSFSTLWVAAYDRAGNVSPARPLKLYGADGTPASVMPGVDAGHMWQTSEMTSPLPSTIPDSNPWLASSATKSLTVPSGVGRGETSTIVAPQTSAVLRLGSLSSASDAVTTSTAPVNATNSFTLSLWVKPADVASPSTQYIATQYGAGRGHVELSLTGGKYVFCIAGAAAQDDAGRPVSSCVTAPSAAVAGSWTLLTAVWDSVNQQLRLVQGGTTSPTAVAPHVVGSGDWSANGALVFGPPPNSSRFTGYIANPLIVPAILNSDQMTELSFLGNPFTS